MAKAVVIYGIKNCDTMKKARAWLEKHGVDYSFHDYKTTGIERERLQQWCKTVGWEMLLNRAGTTFRKLPDRDKAGVDAKKAVALMLAQPSMIRRPVLDLGGGKLLVGFKPELYDAAVTARGSPVQPHSKISFFPHKVVTRRQRNWRRGGRCSVLSRDDASLRFCFLRFC